MCQETCYWVPSLEFVIALIIQHIFRLLGMEADLWRSQLSGRRKSMDWKQSELLFLHENYPSLESCQADGVEPRLTWQQLSAPPIDGNPIWLGNYEN